MGQANSKTLSKANRRWVDIDLGHQRLALFQGTRCIAAFPVSTARAGPGEREGSFQTPRGWHCVRAKIGAGVPQGAVFVARRWAGEIYSPRQGLEQPDRDWILTRILWLSGLETGRNRLGTVDTMRRYIYIHGCPDEVALGAPGSKGCIRMHGAALVELFEAVPVGTRVFIHE